MPQNICFLPELPPPPVRSVHSSTDACGTVICFAFPICSWNTLFCSHACSDFVCQGHLLGHNPLPSRVCVCPLYSSHLCMLWGVMQDRCKTCSNREVPWKRQALKPFFFDALLTAFNLQYTAVLSLRHGLWVSLHHPFWSIQLAGPQTGNRHHAPLHLQLQRPGSAPGQCVGHRHQSGFPPKRPKGHDTPPTHQSRLRFHQRKPPVQCHHPSQRRLDPLKGVFFPLRVDTGRTTVNISNRLVNEEPMIQTLSCTVAWQHSHASTESNPRSIALSALSATQGAPTGPSRK